MNIKKNEHPEVKDIKNICNVSPKTKDTEGVCDKIKDASQQNTNKKNVEKK